MAKVIEGDRIARDARVIVGVAAVLRGDEGKAILLTRRRDNDLWCLPSGHLDPGESVEEACRREVREEIGVETDIDILLGVYSSPNRIIRYPDSDPQQPVTLVVRAHIIGGEIRLSEETTEWGHFSEQECRQMAIMEDQVEILADAFQDDQRTYLR